MAKKLSLLNISKIINLIFLNDNNVEDSNELSLSSILDIEISLDCFMYIYLLSFNG